MRITCIIGREHGKKSWSLVAGPEVPLAQQLRVMQDARVNQPVNATYAELVHLDELHVSAPCKFVTQVEADRIKATRAKHDADVKRASQNAEALQQQRDNAAAKAIKDAHQAAVDAVNSQHAALLKEMGKPLPSGLADALKAAEARKKSDQPPSQPKPSTQTK